jgi:uncharacterized membrane protein YoaK (UPF0700 family)
LLLMLTIVTGMVDAVSFIALGRVFVANMTGNVVFLGFAVGGAPGLSPWASIVALGAFLVGALAGGRIARYLETHRGRHLAGAAAFGLGLMLVAIVVAAAAEHPRSGAPRFALIMLLAAALGTQNATARRLAIPDLTTSVLTLTLTGLVADSTLGDDRKVSPLRRILPVGAMFVGAVVGAVLVLNVGLTAPIALAGPSRGSRRCWPIGSQGATRSGCAAPDLPTR